MRPTKIMNRLNGYDPHFRGRFLLLRRKLLSDSEFILWDLGFSSLAEWDRKNHDPKDYGSFNYQKTEIGYLLGWHKSKVSRKAEKLITLGLWVERDNRIFVNGFDIRDNFAQISKNKKVIDLQEYVAILQPVVAEPQPPVADLQRQTSKGSRVVSPQSVAILQPPRPKASLVSFKNEFNGHRSDEEYQEIYGQNPNGLSTEDMKLADESIWESMGIGPHGEKRYEEATC